MWELNCNLGQVVQQRVYLDKILPGRQPGESIQRLKPLCFRSIPASLTFHFKQALNFQLKCFKHHCKRLNSKRNILMFSSCQDFACWSSPLLFAFERGNPEIGNSLGNAQPGWGQPSGATWGASGESLWGQRTMARACSGEPELNSTGFFTGLLAGAARRIVEP